MAFLALIDDAARWPAAPLGHPSVGVRVRALVHGLDLTRKLAAGADPTASPELALRARQLTRPREIRGLVDRLEHVLREAAAPPRGLTAQAPLQRAAILAARPFLLNLRDRLRETEHPRPAGIARTLLLLMDGSGPLYAPSDPGTLASLVYRAADAL